MVTSSTSFSRLRRSGLRRSIIGASAVGSVAAALQTAHAKIVYSGVKNLSTSSLVGTSAVPDIEPVQLSSISNKGTDFNLYSFNTKGSDFHSLYDPGRFDHFAPIVSTSPGEFNVVQRFAKGEIIDSLGTFPAGSPTSVTLISNAPNSQWAAGTDGYFGYRFDTLGPTPLYGWGRISLSPDAKVMTLVDWAYDNTGAPIEAGQIPEPTTSLFLSMSLAFAAFMRRRSNTTSRGNATP